MTEDEDFKKLMDSIAPAGGPDIIMSLMNAVISRVMVDSIGGEEELYKMYLWTKPFLRYRFPTMKQFEDTNLQDLMEKLRAADFPQFDLTLHADYLKYDDFFFGVACNILLDVYGSFGHHENINYATFFTTPPKDVTKYNYYTNIKKRGRKPKLTTLMDRYLKSIEEEE